MFTETWADIWTTQEPGPFLDHSCIALFKDFSVARYDAQDMGWYVQQLTPEQFLQVHRLVDSFRPIADETNEPVWVQGVKGSQSAQMTKDGRIYFVIVDTYLDESAVGDVTDDRGMHVMHFLLPRQDPVEYATSQMRLMEFCFISQEKGAA